MRLQFSTTLALLLVLLTGHSLAYNKCYSSGHRFEDVGTDEEIDQAFSDVCAKLSGTYNMLAFVCRAMLG